MTVKSVHFTEKCVHFQDLDAVKWQVALCYCEGEPGLITLNQ